MTFVCGIAMQDDYYLSTISMDSNKVIILDIRVPSLPAAELTGHSSCINSLAWYYYPLPSYPDKRELA
jgi:hypothetical protein